MQILSKFNNISVWISEKLMIIFLGTNIILLFGSALFRFVLKIGQIWVEEVAIGLMIWSVLLGCNVAIKKSAHIKMEMIQNKIPLVYRRWLTVFIYIIILSFLFIVIKYGYDWAYLLRKAYFHSLRIKINWINSAILIGFGFSFLQALELLILESKDIILGFSSKGRK